ncbi:hypothetical protein PGT21_018311 [Puccinia graminis f. sp. tritici]|uniref:Secreted protein n=1 Tax=Puccinia graminis f. sp. tritici TaxID=56615 RepID=A0A5B0P879_PUCGR|nr:hypothetical protein PGT21_018311 [Puccinia graminis f. sp. tritici]KAA1126039.1 hypothetical protein PGTUg99_016610 [Puccinia graminis f. sp. tritici]
MNTLSTCLIILSIFGFSHAADIQNPKGYTIRNGQFSVDTQEGTTVQCAACRLFNASGCHPLNNVQAPRTSQLCTKSYIFTGPSSGRCYTDQDSYLCDKGHTEKRSPGQMPGCQGCGAEDPPL